MYDILDKKKHIFFSFFWKSRLSRNLLKPLPPFLFQTHFSFLQFSLVRWFQPHSDFYLLKHLPLWHSKPFFQGHWSSRYAQLKTLLEEKKNLTAKVEWTPMYNWTMYMLQNRCFGCFHSFLQMFRFKIYGKTKHVLLLCFFLYKAVPSQAKRHILVLVLLCWVSVLLAD